MVLAVILVLVVGLMPVPSSRLEKRLQEAFQEAFGGAATFSSCNIRILRGASIRDFRLYTDETQQELLLECSRVRVGYNPLFYPLTGSYGLYLAKPRLVVPAAVDGQLQMPKSLSQPSKGDSKGTSGVPSYVRVDDARIEYVCMLNSVPVVGEDIDISLTRLRSDKPKALECRGRVLWGGQGFSFTSGGTVNLQEKSSSLSGMIRPVTGSLVSVNLGKYPFSAKRVPWTLQGSFEGSAMNVEISLNPQEGTVALTESLKPSLKQANGTLRYDKSTGKIVVQDFAIGLDNYHASAKGEFGLTGYKPFHITLLSQDMPSEVIRVLVSENKPELPIVLVSGILGFELETSGLMTNPKGMFSQGRLDCQGCTFEHVATGFRLTNVTGGLDVSPEEAVFHNLQAHYTDKAFSLHGSIKGDPFIWENPIVDVTAQGEIDLTQTGKFIHALTPDALGESKISGNALLDISASGALNDPNNLQFDGSVEMQNVNVSGGIFTVPFSRVSGKVDFKDGTMNLVSLQGTTGKTTVTVEGTWKRGTHSWKDGEVDLKLVGVAEGDEIFPVLERSLPEYLEGYRAQGPLEYDLSLTGLIDSASERFWSGNAILSQGTLQGGVLIDALSDVTAEISLQSNKLDELSLRWKRANVPGRLSYTKKAGRHTFLFRADSQIEELRRFSERYLDWETKDFQFAGSVFSDVEMNWLEAASDQASVKGRIDFEGCEINSTKWLVPIENLEGLVRIDDSMFVSDRLSFSSGKASAAIKAMYKKGSFSMESLESVQLADLMGKLQQLYPDKHTGWSAGGELGFTLKSEPPRVEDGTAALRSYEGDLSFYEAFVKTDRMDQPVEKVRGMVHFDRNAARADDLVFAFAGTEGTCSFVVEDYDRPVISGEVLAVNLDVTRILEMMKFRSTATPQSKPAGLNLQRVSGILKADKFRFSKLSGTDLSTRFGWSDQEDVTSLDLSEITFSPWGGKAVGAFEAAMRETDLIYSGSLQASNVSLRDMLTAIGSSSPGQVDGEFDLKIAYNGTGLTADDFEAQGEFEARDVTSLRHDFFARMAEAVKLDLFREISFDKVYAPFIVTDKRVFTDDLRWIGRFSEMQWKGSIGLDHSLNYDIKAAISASGASGTSAIDGTPAGPLFRFLTAKSIDLSLTGTLSEPKFAVRPLRTLIQPAKDIGEIVIVPVGRVIDTLRSLPPQSNRRGAQR